MLELKDFVVSPEIAHSPELLRAFLISELGTNLLNSCQYRIEKKSIDARSRQIKVNLRIGLYEKNHDFSLRKVSKSCLNTIVPNPLPRASDETQI